MQAGGRRFDPVILHHFGSSRFAVGAGAGRWGYRTAGLSVGLVDVMASSATQSVVEGLRGCALSLTDDAVFLFFNNLEEAQQ